MYRWFSRISLEIPLTCLYRNPWLLLTLAAVDLGRSLFIEVLLLIFEK